MSAVVKIKYFWFLWTGLLILLFPWSPLQFTNPVHEFFRTWLFMLMPALLCPLILISTRNRERAPERVAALSFVVPISLVFLLSAAVDCYSMSDAICLNQNRSSRPLRKIQVGSKMVATYLSNDFVQVYLDIEQEWPIGNYLKFVRYIDRRADAPDDVVVVDDNTIKYGIEGWITKKLW